MIKAEKGGPPQDQNTDVEDDYVEEEEIEEEDDDHRYRKSRNGSNSYGSSTGSAMSQRDSVSSTTPTASARPRTQSNDWEQEARPSQTHPTPPGRPVKRPSFQRNVSFSEDSRSSHNRSPLQHHTPSHKVPYFRYFGPTAIVPGFKQMVVNVSVRDRRRSRGGSFSGTSPGSIISHGLFSNSNHSNHSETVLEGAEEMPAYDPNDPAPVHPIILSLLKTFFLHLGCNYPFLRSEAKFIRLVKEKRVEAILVDAMCSLSARFSELPIFATEGDRADYGHVFAQRARAATVDTFPCPTVGAVQACLLLAYEGFGANQDSTLWMYLGLAIRMAVDLGIGKQIGVQYQGEKDPWYIRSWNRKNSDGEDIEQKAESEEVQLSPEEQHELEQERTDTFWAVFILDRVISSGTGRPVTFREDDFELALPDPAVDPVTGWPAPFPTLIQIIHLYGRVSDVLNNIRGSKDLTQDKMNRLVKMEHELTKLYQKQDPRLHFNALNFQEYVKAGQGTNFILLHFWFHALIIILHQPTLLATLGKLDRTHQLLPHSRELSMSSAKTIADILAFAELIDPKSFIGNPFTSQPMYIAACAFLMESVANSSNPTSRDTTPPSDPRSEAAKHHTKSSSGDARSAKHSLLASAANQNYQRCYKSLEQLNTYWGGVKYILTALDQKSKGIWDCETYTNEEYESTKLPRRASLSHFAGLENPASPNVPPIAWSLTGTTNSPNSSLTLLYQSMNTGTPQPIPVQQPQPSPATASTPPGNMIYDPIRQSLPETTSMLPPAYPQQNVSAIRYSAQQPKQHRGPTSSMPGVHGPSRSALKYEGLGPDGIGSDTPGRDSRHQPLRSMNPGNPQAQAPPAHGFTSSSHQHPAYDHSELHGASSTGTLTDPSAAHQHNSLNGMNNGGYLHDFAQSGLASGSYSYLNPNFPITNVITFDSQEIDIGALDLPTEMMPPWLEYLPGDVLGLFDNSPNGGNHHQM